jgi:hypothetical protein
MSSAVTETALGEAVTMTASPETISKTSLPIAAFRTDSPDNVAITASPDVAEGENLSPLNPSRNLDKPYVKEPVLKTLSNSSDSDSVPSELPIRTEPPLPSVSNLDGSDIETPQTKPTFNGDDPQAPISTGARIGSYNEPSRMNTQTDPDPYTTQDKENTPKPKSGWGRT